METNYIMNGDCIEELKKLPDNSIDAIITDPPYGLSFMGKKWDYDVPSQAIWEECLRVLKPGGHLLAFAGTRTQHRMAVRIEDAGFEIRDMIAWIYGSGFPKSLNIGKAVDKLQGNEREVVGKEKGAGTTGDNQVGNQTFVAKNQYEDGTHDITKGTSEWEGWGTALKPAVEPIVVARKPLSEKNVALNVLKWGTGGINIDGCRVEGNEELGRNNHTNPYGSGRTWSVSKTPPQNNVGKAPTGRFPANLIHDGSDEVVGLFPQTKSGKMGKQHTRHTDGSPNGIYGKFDINHELGETYGDSGSASRFFYCAKASKSERNNGCEELEEQERRAYTGAVTSDPRMNHEQNRFPTKNNHPTVKPVALMEYLIKLVSRENAIVLDPFLGSGTTAIACLKTNRKFIGIEKEPEYIKIAQARIKPYLEQRKLLLEEKQDER